MPYPAEADGAFVAGCAPDTPLVCGYDDVSPECAGAHLYDLIVNMKHAGKLTASAACIISFWAVRAGACGPTEALARRPGLGSGKYSAHFDKVVAGGTPADNDWYEVAAPMHDRAEDSRVVRRLPLRLPHESLVEHFEVRGPELIENLRDALANDKLPPNYASSPVVQGAPIGTHVLPICLYIDGVGFSREDTATGLWMSCLLTGRRWLLCAIRKSTLCSCGCHGWCTYYVVFATIHWSLLSLACGRHPETRHDGAPFDPEEDANRHFVRGLDLPIRACVVAVRGDWMEISCTLGFPTWKHRVAPCPWCTATQENRGDFRALSLRTLPHAWRLRTWDDYCAACESCERVRALPHKDWRLSRAALVFDKRYRGGRLLRVGLPDAELEAGDRLEPSQFVGDIGAGYDAANPTTAVLWHFDPESPVLHRSSRCSPLS